MYKIQLLNKISSGGLELLPHELYEYASEIVGPDATWKDIPFYKPKQTAEDEDGYKGRIGIHEVLKMTPTIKDMVIHGKSADEIEAQAKNEGLITMLEDGIFKAAQGETTIEEVLRVVAE